jgi:hypothetical protein
MSISVLIKALQNYQNQYGDVDCLIAIDTPDAFNETILEDIVVNIYNVSRDDSIYKVCLKGEMIPESD